MGFWVLSGLICANAACVAANAVYFWRVHRRLRHIEVMDHVLTQICVEAFSLAHLPIWQAWTAVMGDICIEVSANRRGYGEP